MGATGLSRPGRPARVQARVQARIPAATWVLAAALVLAAPWVFTSAQGRDALIQVGIALVACLSCQLLLGQGGMLSFGHAVYLGAGGFVAIHVLRAGVGVPVSLLPLVGGLAALALAGVLGWVTTRRSGTPFAMITLGVGELVWAGAQMFPGVFGGEAGISANRVTGSQPLGITFGPPVQLYYLVAAYALACVAAVHAFTRTPLGRLLNAVRDNPGRAAFTGHDPRMVRYLAFCFAATLAGVSGGLAALHFEIVSADAFSAQRSAQVLLFTFLGGSAHALGPWVAAVLMVVCLVLLSGVTQAWLLYIGLLFMVMVVVAPGGLAGLAAQGWQAIRAGRMAGRGGAALALASSGLLALAGGAVLAEMAYHLPLRSALGPVARVGGLALDTASPGPWAAAAAALLVGGGAFAWLVARWRRDRLQPMPAPNAAAGEDDEAPGLPATSVPQRLAAPADAPAVLELRDIHLALGRTAVLRGASLSLRAGETLALIGPNGAGKSTLFAVASGLRAPDAGQVLLQGRSIAGLAPFRIRRRGLSRGFQTSSLFPQLSVADNLRCAVLWGLGHRYTVARPLSALGEADREVDRLLADLGLDGVRELPAHALAQAHQRTLEIGLALAGGAPVLLLDEPTAGMSRRETQAMVARLRRLAAGRSVLLVEHDMDVVFGLADRVAVMVDGRVIAVDTPERVRADPRVQAAYLGALPAVPDRPALPQGQPC